MSAPGFDEFYDNVTQFIVASAGYGLTNNEIVYDAATIGTDHSHATFYTKQKSVYTDELKEDTASNGVVATGLKLSDDQIKDSSGNIISIPTATSTLATLAVAETLTNKTLIDDSTIFQDNLDNTKQFKLGCAYITAGNLRTLDMPDISTTLVGTEGEQTLIQKTFYDNSTYIRKSTDSTAKVQFDCSLIPTASTASLKFPYAVGAQIITENNVQTLSNKTLTAPVISTISNTGTLTLPTSTDTLVGRATSDTLTNKQLTSPTADYVISTTDANTHVQLGNQVIYNTSGTTGITNLTTTEFGLTGVDFIINGATKGIVDENDKTKRAILDLSSITTATSRTFTFPDRTGILGLNNKGTATINTTSSLTAAQSGSIILCDNHAGITLTLPIISATQIYEYYIINTDATPNTVTISRASTNTIDNGSTVSIALVPQYSKTHLISTSGGIWFTI